METSINNNHDSNELSLKTMIILVKCAKENIKFHDIYVKKNKFRIGHAIDCDERILSPSISRYHCILIYNNGHWSITNLSSSYIILNGEKIDRNASKHINVGDEIQLSESQDYKFEVAMYIKDEPKKKKRRLSQSVLDQEVINQKLFAEEQELKRRELEVQLINKQKEQEQLKERLNEILKSKEAAEGKTEELNNIINFLKEKIKSGNEVELQMLYNYDHLLFIVEIQQKKFEKRLNEEREKWKQSLKMSNQEKAVLQKNMTKQVSAWQRKQRIEWGNVINKLVQRENYMLIKFMNEKKLLQQRLKEANNALQEKTALAEELKNSIQNLPVNQEVSRTVDQIKIESSSSKISDKIVEKVEYIMDAQLTCQICSELFITAVTLNCAHTYCQYCIFLWMRKKQDCPICRESITSVTRSLVLDNFIEQMVNDLSTQHKEQRKSLSTQRKAISQQLGVPNISKEPCARRNNRR